MEQSRKVDIGRLVMRNKQYTAAIRTEEGRLVMSSLAYADDLVDPADIEDLQGLDDVEVKGREVMMAESLVAPLSSDYKCHDEYRQQVMALIQMKADGEEWEAPEIAAEKSNVVDIMAALEASVAAAKEPRARHLAGDLPMSVSTKADIAAAAKKSAAKKRVVKLRAKQPGSPRPSVRVRRSRRPNRLRRRPPPSRSSRRVGPRPGRGNQPDR